MDGSSQNAAGRWPLATVLSAGLAVACALVAATGPQESAVLAWNVAFTTAAGCALAGMLAAWRGGGADERDRWAWWAAAAASWLVGQVLWDLFTLVRIPPTPSPADAGWWGFAVLVGAGLVAGTGRSAGVRLVALVEVLPLLAAAMALTFAELWEEAAASPLGTSGRVSALTYPVLYVSAAMLTLQSMVGGSLRPVRGPGPRIVLLGIVIQAVAFIFWSRQLLLGTYATGETLVDPLWIGGLIAIGAGGVLAARRPERQRDVDEMSRRGGLLPAGTFLLLMGALVRAGFSEPSQGARLALAVGLLTSGATLIARALLLERRLRVLLGLERTARRALAAREAELARLNERLHEDSRRDPLTGLRNRRALVEELPELEAAGPFAVAVCDVDRFKAYNDLLGHLAGDAALRALAATVRGELRPGDRAYRYGGEELVLVLGEASAAEALAVAQRIRRAVKAVALPHPGDPSGVVTVSIGVAAGRGNASSLLGTADRALYEAKRHGRDRVWAAREDEAAPALPPATPADEPVLRHLHSMLAVSRAAATGGAAAVLEAAAGTIRSELRFQTVAVNLRDRASDDVPVVLVLGDAEARDALLGTSCPWSTWEGLLDPRHERCGAFWLPAGTYEDPDGIATWAPSMTPGLDPDAWHPDDMLLLPLRGADGDILAVISVDEPLSGRRPSDGELGVLMAVADHAALALERTLQRPGAAPESQVSGELRLAAVMLLAETLDLRDAGTAEHSRTVGALVRETAAELGLPAARVERLHAAGVLHDLGKLGIADAILHKPGPLDEAEWREMRRHPEIGARILEHAGLHDIAGWVRAHHERMDGRGYPSALPAEEIPLEARILAVADAYEAMVADRPYRPGMPAEAACDELRRCAGTQFDPEVVAAFVAARGYEGAAAVALGERRMASAPR